MDNFSRTFKKDALEIDAYCTYIEVWTAITDNNNGAAGTLEINIYTDHVCSSSRVKMTPAQMVSLADFLVCHAERLEALELEAADLLKEAA